jgi:VWFA-related protein
MGGAAAHAPATLPKSATPPAPRARFVPILISATDASGNPATGLTKDQFSILDTMHAAQPLQAFKAEDIPLHLAVVLLAAQGSFSQQQAAAIALVQKVVRPKVDEAFVVSARGKKPWPSSRLDWSQDPAELVKTIEGLDRNAGLHDAFNFDLQTDEIALDENAGRNTTQTYSGGGVSVFDAVYSMMNSDPRPARRVMVIFREPWAHSPGFGNRVNTAVDTRMQRLIAVAQEMHIATFVIGLEDPKFNGVTDNTLGKNYISLHAGEDGGGGSATRAFDQEMEKEKIHAYDGGKANIQRLAAETGGTTFWSTKKNFPDAVAGIANLLAGQYIITFTPSDAPTPVHTLKVASSGAAKVLAPTAFFFGAPQ